MAVYQASSTAGLLQGGGGFQGATANQGATLPNYVQTGTQLYQQPAVNPQVYNADNNGALQNQEWGASTTGGYYGGGGSAPAPRYGSDGASSAQSSGDWAYLDDQQRQLDTQSGLIDQTERNGLTQLGDSYNQEVSGANTKQ